MLQIFAEKPAVRRAFLDFVPKKARPICIINISACTVGNSGTKMFLMSLLFLYVSMLISHYALFYHHPLISLYFLISEDR